MRAMASLQKCCLFCPCFLGKRRHKNHTIKSITTTTMTIFLFLILMVHIQPSSLLKLHSSSFPQDKHEQKEARRLEKSTGKVNKAAAAAALLWKDPDAARSASTASSLLLSDKIRAAHYSPKAHFVQRKEKLEERKTNSLNTTAAAQSVIIQDDPNEKGGKRNSLSDNNDKDDDGRQVSSKTTTASSTFDLATTTTSTLYNKENSSQKRARKIRSLKNDTDAQRKKVARAGSSGDGDIEGNHYDKHRELVLGDVKKSDITRGNFIEQVTTESRKEAEAIESFQKTFVNGNDVSVAEAVAFAGMDMGILAKFEKGPKSSSSAGKAEEGKSEDKKNIQRDKQLSPSELGDGNNDIKMQDFQHLTSSAATITSSSNDNIPSAAASVLLKESGPPAKGNGKRANTATNVESGETGREKKVVSIRSKEEDEYGGEVDDNHDDKRHAWKEEEVEFHESLGGAPEGIESIENVSFFYSHNSNRENDKNNNSHQPGRNQQQQSSRLTFASYADFDKVGSSKTGGGGGRIGPDLAASAISTAANDEVKLYTLVQKLLKASPLIDGHNDLPWNLRKFLHGQLLEFKFDSDLRTVSPWSKSAWSQTDLPRLRRGLVGAQFFVAYSPCDSQHLNAVQITLEQIDLIRRLIARYPDDLALALTADDIERAHRAGKIASLIAVEGGHSIGNSLSTLRSFYELGVRYMTLTHNCNTPWADSARPGHKPEHGGLTEFGRAVVREMNRLGMLVDLSHTSKLTMKDALKVSKAPVIFSHSSAFTLCNSSRNVPDDILKELVWNGGIIMVTFYNIYVKCHTEATVRDVADHINYIRGKIPLEHIGIGSDFDGINLTPVGLEDVSKFPNLFVELARNPSWNNTELQMLAGRNFLRVFRDAEKVRDNMRSTGTQPSFEFVPPRDLGEGTRCRHNDSSLASPNIH